MQSLNRTIPDIRQQWWRSPTHCYQVPGWLRSPVQNWWIDRRRTGRTKPAPSQKRRRSNLTAVLLPPFSSDPVWPGYTWLSDLLIDLFSEPLAKLILLFKPQKNYMMTNYESYSQHFSLYYLLDFPGYSGSVNRLLNSCVKIFYCSSLVMFVIRDNVIN